MQTFYLIRHAQTEADTDKIIGCTDIAPSRQGEKNVKTLAKSLPKLTSATVYSSTLLRAAKTAEILFTKSDLVIERSSLINEMDFGEWEESTWDDAYKLDPEKFSDWAQNWMDVAAPGGESFNDVAIRCQQFFDQIDRSAETVIIVAHGGSIRALLCLMLDLPFNCAFNFEFQHCHVSKIQFDQDQAKTVYLNAQHFV